MSWEVRGRASATFEALYAGTCARCHSEIDPGDVVRYVDDELVHYRHSIIEKPVDICNRCWLTKPCDCAA